MQITPEILKKNKKKTKTNKRAKSLSNLLVKKNITLFAEHCSLFAHFFD